jgi:hypothetical protein
MAHDVQDDLNDINVFVKQRTHKDLSENNTKCVVEFAASSYAVIESEKVCKIIIERYGYLQKEVEFRYLISISFYLNLIFYLY